jgi:hypothetical protein
MKELKFEECAVGVHAHVCKWVSEWKYMSVNKLARHCKCVRDKHYVISLVVMFCVITVVLDVALCNLVDRNQASEVPAPECGSSSFLQNSGTFVQNCTMPLQNNSNFHFRDSFKYDRFSLIIWNLYKIEFCNNNYLLHADNASILYVWIFHWLDTTVIF